MDPYLRSSLQTLVSALDKLDCGDNSCRFAKNKGGQRTNGGCRCLQSLSPSVKMGIIRVYQDAKKSGEII